MKRILLVSASALLVLLAALSVPRFFASGKDTKTETTPSRAVAAPLPSSLDALYPPRAKEPVFQIIMFGMSAPMTGIMVDLLENEPKNAQANYEKFKTQYQEVSKLVPEWTSRFPLSPVEDLGKALKTGKQEPVIAAFEKLDGVCMACHVENMVPAQHKYHWGNFFAIKIKDPLTQADVGWRTLMQYLDGSFTGISIDLEESEKDKALTNLQGFKMRFQALAGACEECHGTDERKYYVDQSVKGLITDLEKALSQPAPDMKRIGSISNDLGKDACLKCHLVHVPAAISQLPQMGLRAK